MPQIVLKEKTVHLASYFFTKDVDQYKNTSNLQLYQPPQTLTTSYFCPVNIAKFLKTAFL